MFNYYLRLAVRNYFNNKVFSIINLVGLSVAMAVFVLLINYVSYEYSFDSFHSKSDRIFRVESQFYEGSKLTDDWATSSFGYGSAISKEMTGVEDYVRIGINDIEQIVSFEDKRHCETGIVYAGHSFFSIFDYKLIKGNHSDQLVRPNTVVITENAARRYFKDMDPIGKYLSFASGTNFYKCEVTGILEDFPSNSHINFDYLISYETLPQKMKEFWYLHEAYTYLLLAPGINPKEIESKFPKLAEKYKTNDALKDKTWAVSLVPLRDIHLNPPKQYEIEIKGNKKSLLTLMIIAFVILITAWINYVNLTITNSMERAKGIGVRKVSGAQQLELIKQFMMESLLVNLISFLLGISFLIVFRPIFEKITGLNTEFHIFKESLFWLLSLSIFLFGVFISGFYPSVVLSAIKPSVILKGTFFNSEKAVNTRRFLVVFQFAAALFLICGTLVIYQQVKYMQRQSLGVDLDKTIVLKYPVRRTDLDKQVKLFAKNLEANPNVISVSLTGSVPGMEVAKFASNQLSGEEEGKQRLYEMFTIDESFLQAFDFEIIAGRAFQKNYRNELNNLIINEASLKTLGFTRPDDAIGKQVLLEGQSSPVTIIGVVKNWHQRGLENKFTPIMFVFNGRLNWVSAKYIAIKTNGNNYDKELATIQKRWNAYFPEASFDYFFLDKFFDNQYKTDRRFSKIVGGFTLISILISLLGLWALTAYTASKKTKEIGVRKVLGAENMSITILFSKEIILLIVIAMLIAIPLSFWVMNKWLMNYAFHTEIKLWYYLAGSILTLIIAFLTIVLQTWKTTRCNPVEALRYE